MTKPKQPHKKIIGGNWKMNLHREASTELARALARRLDETRVEVCIFPAFPYLHPVRDALSTTKQPIKVGAQDVYSEPDGAFTGEVSLAMLRDLGCESVIVGHSERRHVLGESDLLINDKLLAALEAEFEVVLCVGETFAQREAGQTDAINLAQLSYALAGVSVEQLGRVTIAYEPVWAIGTGKSATPADAAQAHAAIRAYIAFAFGDDAAAAIRIQYGGSVKAHNAAEFFAQDEIDGALVGGASLEADDFVAIVSAAARSEQDHA